MYTSNEVSRALKRQLASVAGKLGRLCESCSGHLPDERPDFEEISNDLHLTIEEHYTSECW